MAVPESSGLRCEWSRLQQAFEGYERGALAIKLAATLLFVAMIALSLDAMLTGAVVLVLWAQEAIWRAAQARIAARLLRVETLLAAGGEGESQAFRLHTEFAAGRPGIAGLVKEYALQLLRPTVAFPHLVLFLVNLVLSYDQMGAGVLPV